MGLADRYYMREGSGRTPLSVTKILMIILVAVFALQAINDVYIQSQAEWYLALTPLCVLRGWVWQLITFQFLHWGLLHLVFNLLVLWWAGGFVESVLGRKRFLVAYLGCGVMGGVLQGILSAIFPEHFGLLTVGASAGVSGMFAIFAMLLRDATVRVWFVLPVSAMTLLWISGIIAFFFTLVPSPRAGGMAHAAHLGGILAGVAWVKLGWHHDYIQLPWEGWWKRLRDRSGRGERIARSTPAKSAKWTVSKAPAPADPPPEEFISREVDPILDKIHAHGIHSLTEEERRILEKARNKMGKR